MLVREKMTCLFVILSVAGIANISADQSSDTLKVKKVYDYDQVLRYSNLFYQAMRSGPLDKLGDFDHYMIPYRGDSCLEDGADNGVDLTGGYFDDMGYNGYVKNTLMTATSTTLLAWGAIDFKEGYEAAGEMEATLNTIRWATDYLIKCYPEENILYIQVGDSDEERENWMRIEDMNLPRLSYKINATDRDHPYFHPGADLAGEMSAALAAASIVFKTADPAYSAVLLDYAKQLYKFAHLNYGSYVADYVDYGTYITYRCGNQCDHGDELLWSAAWLYKATEDPLYMEKVEEIVEIAEHWSYVDWEDKGAGSWVLLAQMTKEERFINFAQDFCSGNFWWFSEGGLLMKPKYKENVLGTLRHAANIAFVCLEVSMIDSPAIDKVRFREFAISQIHYALGDNPWNMSYVVGFGTNPPVYIDDRPSSCPVDANEPCDWNAFNSTNPNPSTIFGALVGGPGPGPGGPAYDYGDQFLVGRDYYYSRVAVTNNAGFQSAVAGLKTLTVQGKLQQ